MLAIEWVKQSCPFLKIASPERCPACGVEQLIDPEVKSILDRLLPYTRGSVEKAKQMADGIRAKRFNLFWKLEDTLASLTEKQQKELAEELETAHMSFA